MSILSLLFYFGWKILLANNVDSDQMPHYVASDLGLHCLPMILLGVLGINGSIKGNDSNDFLFASLEDEPFPKGSLH